MGLCSSQQDTRHSGAWLGPSADQALHQTVLKVADLAPYLAPYLAHTQVTFRQAVRVWTFTAAHVHQCPLLSHVQPRTSSFSRTHLCRSRLRHGQALHMARQAAPASQAPRARAPAPRQRAARPPPTPRRAPQCALGAPGQTCFEQGVMSRIGASTHCSSSPSPWPTLLCTCRVQRLHPHCCTLCNNLKQALAVQQTALLPHMQQAARLLVKLRALERQRCGNALLSRCLCRARLGARLVHPGKVSRSGAHGARWVDEVGSPPAELCFYMPQAATPAWRVQPSRTLSDACILCKSKLGRVHNCRTAAHLDRAAPACRISRAQASAPRPSAARPLPPPQRAPRRALGPPRHRCSISKARHAVVPACRVSRAHHKAMSAKLTTT